MGAHFKVEYKDAVPFIIEIAKHDSKVNFTEIKEWVKPHLATLPHDNLEKYLNEIVLDIQYGHKK